MDITFFPLKLKAKAFKKDPALLAEFYSILDIFLFYGWNTPSLKWLEKVGTCQTLRIHSILTLCSFLS